MNRVDASNFIMEKMREHGLIAKGWRAQFNPRLSRTLGRCWNSKKLIELSSHYVDNNDEKLVKDTILHEIAHALTPGDKHGKLWKAACVRIGAVPKAAWKSPACGLVTAPKALKWRLAVRTDDGVELTNTYKARRSKLGPLTYLRGRPETKGKLFWQEV